MSWDCSRRARIRNETCSRRAYWRLLPLMIVTHDHALTLCGAGHLGVRLGFQPG